MRRNEILLVDIRSPTMDAISAPLLPIECVKHFTVTLASARDLSIELPRFNLTFFVNKDNKLECKNYRAMVIDEDQHIGTMFGLKNMLVLRPSGSHSDPRRMAIIPFGTVRFERYNEHISVEIDCGAQARVRYQTYKIDTELECLAESTTLEGSLFKVYLHALTAHCLPDPLTGRTGTEEALHELNSSRIRSFQHLKDSEVDLLWKIGSLTPHRVFYPTHLRRMQQVVWKCLRPTAQHPRFHTLVNAVLKHAKSLQVFHQDMVNVQEVSRGDNHLLERATRRNAVFYPAEFTDADLTANADIEYKSRDSDLAPLESFIAGVSHKLRHPVPRLKICPSLMNVLEGWSNVEGPQLEDRTSSDWLHPQLAKWWLTLYNFCRVNNHNLYRTIFTLSAVAYTSDNSALVDTLVAFATFHCFRTIHPPSCSSYVLSHGYLPDRATLRRIIARCARPFDQSEAARLPRLQHETNRSFDSRRASQFRASLDSQIDAALDALVRQWPTVNPSLPTASLLKLSDVRDEIQHVFCRWNDNQQLRDHVENVQAALNDKLSSSPINLSKYCFSPCFDSPINQNAIAVQLQSLFVRDVPTITHPPPVLGLKKSSIPVPQKRTKELQHLILKFSDIHVEFFEHYGHDLMKSYRAFENQPGTDVTSPIPYSDNELLKSRDDWEDYVGSFKRATRDALEPQHPIERVVFRAGLWPRITCRSLLGKLSTRQHTNLVKPWTEHLIALGKSIANMHRAQRLVGLAAHNQFVDLFKELENTGFEEWDPVNYPDWLLIQVRPFSFGTYLSPSFHFRLKIVFLCGVIKPGSL